LLARTGVLAAEKVNAATSHWDGTKENPNRPLREEYSEYGTEEWKQYYLSMG